MWSLLSRQKYITSSANGNTKSQSRLNSFSKGISPSEGRLFFFSGPALSRQSSVPKPKGPKQEARNSNKCKEKNENLGCADMIPDAENNGGPWWSFFQAMCYKNCLGMTSETPGDSTSRGRFWPASGLKKRATRSTLPGPSCKGFVRTTARFHLKDFEVKLLRKTEISYLLLVCKCKCVLQLTVKGPSFILNFLLILSPPIQTK